MASLSGKRALVCGASRGIGKACALEFARLGASVTLLSRNQNELAATRHLLSRTPEQQHEILVADSAEPESLNAAVKQELDKRGPYQILLNNTGGPKAGPALLASSEEFVAAFYQHLVSGQVLVQTIVPGMKAAGYGRIINIVSTSVKQPIPDLGVSNTIRGAVSSWAKTLAEELGPFGITVNCILPGFIETERLAELIRVKANTRKCDEQQIRAEMLAQIPLGRFGKPEEIANVVGFLASPQAAYVTGVNLPVDGGRTKSL